MTTKCSACQADVVFVPSAKSGKAMILDAKPRKGGVLVLPGITNQLVPPEGVPHPAVAIVDVYTDHHATCPDADKFRRNL